ncbi:MAG: PKD domain-containing protein, partial [Ginsengibacter sp.]
MKLKKLIIFFLLLIYGSIVKADHITGGEMYYTSTPGSNGMILYNVTLKLFMRCNSGREFIDPSIVSVFNRSTNARISDVSVFLGNQKTIQLNDAGPCVTNPPVVCYVIGTYIFQVALPASPEGYILSTQVNYRIANISNLSAYNNMGATYTCEIPGTSPVVSGPLNNSAQFTGNDLVIICANNRFSYSFGATDSDGDKLRYSFCNAYVSGTTFIGSMTTPPLAPPYTSVPYGSAFGGSIPLGSDVQIDQNTGLITGIAPATGIYVVTVCVEEIRNGTVIATQRKDLQINIADCDIAAASLQPEYQLCRDTKTLSVFNLSNSPLIKSQEWEFKNSSGAIVSNTASSVATYTFTDTGLYTITLVINRGQACSDSAVSLVRVYPGFVPAFDYAGICFNKPTNFTNTTTTVYGMVNSWKWDFGDPVTEDTSSQQNPSYTYQSMGVKTALLTTGNSNGCRDTVTHTISIFDKPPLDLAFTDTLICLTDKVQLKARGSGLYNWTPAINIVNGNTPSPTVSPVTTTRYYADLNEQGCLNRDSVLVRVTDHVTLTAMSDTVICQGDPVQLRVISDGFQYSWTPAAQMEDANVPNPVAVTNAVTTYEVTALIGSCSAKDQVTVTPVPYPFVNAGADTVICFNTPAQLHGITDGPSFTWSPADFLTNTDVLNPVSNPSGTITYILSAFDTRGCPKPGSDSVQVIVLADIHAYAGNDTAIVTGEDLQLNATGGTSYAWSPSIGLSSVNIGNPVARYNEASEGLRYNVVVYNEAGCTDTASINIKVFATPPSV